MRAYIIARLKQPEFIRFGFIARIAATHNREAMPVSRRREAALPPWRSTCSPEPDHVLLRYARNDIAVARRTTPEANSNRVIEHPFAIGNALNLLPPALRTEIISAMFRVFRP